MPCLRMVRPLPTCRLSRSAVSSRWFPRTVKDLRGNHTPTPYRQRCNAPHHADLFEVVYHGPLLGLGLRAVGGDGVVIEKNTLVTCYPA